MGKKITIVAALSLVGVLVFYSSLPRPELYERGLLHRFIDQDILIYLAPAWVILKPKLTNAWGAIFILAAGVVLILQWVRF
jgi:hypothetical protein